jgi:uncharacterized protein (TIRG00374 family)
MFRKRFLIGILLSAVFLYLFLRNTDLASIWREMKQGSPWWLFLCTAMSLFGYIFRAWRWKYFFVAAPRAPRLVNLTTTTVIGFAVNTVFPAKIGEVVRPYLLGARENIPKTTALATIVVERVFDSLTVVLILVTYLLILLRPEQLSAEARASISELKRAGVIVFAVIVAVVSVLYTMKTRPAAFKRFVQKIERFLPQRVARSIDEIVDSFISGLSILHDPRTLFKISYWSVGLWLIICTSFWAGVRAYVPDFDFTNTFLIMILLAIGVAVPTPGAVGSYHLACKIGLARFFGVPEDEAGAIALVVHFLSFVPVTILGLFFLWQLGLSRDRLSKIAEAPKDVA